MPSAEQARRLAISLEARQDYYFFVRRMFAARRGYRWAHNWHHERICRAMERVFRGETTRLIINVPPRYSKTELAVVNFIAWSLGHFPDAEFIHTSYSRPLAVANSFAARQIVESDAYREIFPRVVLRQDSSAKGDWRTTAGGVVYATGAEGTITGFGAGKMREGFGGCFPYEQLIETEIGPLRIGDIVTKQIPVRVWSFNEKAKKLELQPIDTLWTNPANDILEFKMPNGSLFRCTPNHKLLTSDGWIPASDFAKALDLVNRKACFLSCLRSGLARISGYAFHIVGMLGFVFPRGVGKVRGNAAPCFAGLDLANNTATDSIFPRNCVNAGGADKNINRLIASQFGSRSTLKNRKGSMPKRVLHVFGLGSPRKVVGAVVEGVAVKVAAFLSRLLMSVKSLKHKVMDISHGHFPAHGQIDPKVSLAVAASFENAQWRCSADIAKARNLIDAECVRHIKPNFVGVVGHADKTFCLEVRNNHNFILSQSGAIVSNCIIVDDPHKADEARSDTVRKNVIDWFQNTLESRKNDPARTPIILIMQRLHESDLSGFLLAGGNGETWEHIVLPAISDAGEALWPAKHGIEQLRVMEKASPYVFAGQYQQRPAPPAGGEFKPDQMATVEAIPAGTRLVRAWDLAGTDGDGDWTAGGLLGKMPDGRYVIADMARFREGPEVVEATVKATAQRDGKAVTVAMPQDPGQAGKAQARAYARLLAGYQVSAKPVSGDKVTRARPFAAQVNIGNVVLLAGGYQQALIDEMRTFPNGANDDQIDALSLAFDELENNALGLLDFYRDRALEQQRLRESATG